MSEDPLNSLLLDADVVNRATLAEALKGLIGVDKASGRVVLKPDFPKLKPRQKVLAYLLGRKVAVLLGVSKEEPAGYKVIQTETGMPPGTVGPKLRELFEERLVSQTDKKDYYVGPGQIHAAIEDLEGGG